jgi:thiamine pyrophosphate-dependent acetolactate synthase large subunit-like protein
MKLSDYIVQRLARWGVRHVFLATGSAAMSCSTHSRNLNRAHERSKCPMAVSFRIGGHVPIPG